MDNSRAACKDSDDAYSLAFSPNMSDTLTMIAEYCYHCPIRLTCLVEAIDNDYYGVFGGKTRKQRHELAGINKIFKPTG